MATGTLKYRSISDIDGGECAKRLRNPFFPVHDKSLQWPVEGTSQCALRMLPPDTDEIVRSFARIPNSLTLRNAP